MKGRLRLAVALVLACFLCSAAFQHGFFGRLARSIEGPTQSTAGDLDADGRLTIGDAIYLLDFLFLGGPPPASCGTATATETRTIFILRHAEKDVGVDPSLTELGQERALRLVETLRDVTPDLLLASTLRRTIETLKPLAKSRGLPVEMLDNVDEIVVRLQTLPPGGQAIVAHHSFTIRPILCGLGLQPEDIEGINLSDFDNLFVVTCSATEAAPHLTRLRYASDLNFVPPPPPKKEL